MKAPAVLGPAAQAAVAAIVVLGLVGGSLIVAQSGFATSPKRGGPSTFVPAPEAYVLAALLYGMSGVGLLALLRSRGASRGACAVAVALCVGAAVALSIFLAPR